MLHTTSVLSQKGIDLMDEAASRVRLRYSTLPTDVKEAQKELDKLVTDKDQAMEAQQYELASTLRQKERAQQDKLQQAKADWLLAQSQKRPEVTDEDIAEVVSMWTGIPVRRLAEEEEGDGDGVAERLVERGGGGLQRAGHVARAGADAVQRAAQVRGHGLRVLQFRVPRRAEVEREEVDASPGGGQQRRDQAAVQPA